MFEAQKLHATLLKTGLQDHTYRCNLLLNAYAKSNSFSEAHKFLNLMSDPNVVSYNTLLSAYTRSRRIHGALKLFSTTPQTFTDSRSWNIIISGYIENQRIEEAMNCFGRMIRSSISPDEFTYTIILPCCNLNSGRQIHAQTMKVSLCSDVFLGTNLVRMYGEAGEMEDAEKIFDEMLERDMVSWNALMSCHSKFGKGEFSSELFCRMVRCRVGVDEYTLATILNEFASRSQVFEAMQVHSMIIRRGFCFDRFTTNALLNCYCKCGFVSSAAQLVEEIIEPDVVSWTAFLVGLVEHGFEEDAIRVFYWMRLSGVQPNSFTFGGLLSACASANTFERDMYSKCGEMSDALRLFQNLPEKDLVSWNGMICGFSQNGDAIKALELYDQMVKSGQTSITPNEVTFVGVLSACSHCGLVSEGCRHFSDMVHEYKVEPKAEHYTCMVDILARAGYLRDAETLLLASPFKPDSVMWGTLLGACKIHQNFGMARAIADRLFVDEPENSSNYVLLSNMYVETGEWDDALEVREVMHSRGAQKLRGSSWMEIRKQVHSFVSGDKYHYQIEEIYTALQRLCLQMVEEGHEYDSTLAGNTLKGSLGATVKVVVV